MHMTAASLLRKKRKLLDRDVAQQMDVVVQPPAVQTRQVVACAPEMVTSEATTFPVEPVSVCLL